MARSGHDSGVLWHRRNYPQQCGDSINGKCGWGESQQKVEFESLPPRVITILCDEHKRQAKEWDDADRAEFPDSTNAERRGRYILHLLDRPVRNCSDCKLMGISRHTHRVEELNDASDWIFS